MSKTLEQHEAAIMPVIDTFIAEIQAASKKLARDLTGPATELEQDATIDALYKKALFDKIAQRIEAAEADIDNTLSGMA